MKFDFIEIEKLKTVLISTNKKLINKITPISSQCIVFFNRSKTCRPLERLNNLNFETLNRKIKKFHQIINMMINNYICL